MHTVLDIIAKLRPEPANLDSLRALLRQFDEFEPRGRHPDLPVASIPRIHFTSLIIFEDHSQSFGPCLVFEHNFHGTLDGYLEELVRKCATGLHKIYSHCAGYAAASPSDEAGILGFLRAHLVKPDAYHIGNPGRTVERIRKEAGLKKEIESFLDARVAAGLGHAAPPVIRQEIQGHVRRNPDTAWAARSAPRLTLGERLVPWAKLIGVVLLFLLLLPVLLPFIIVYVIVLRRHEKRDPSAIPPPRAEKVQELMSREDRVVQNHLASMTYVKPGAFRRHTLRGTLRATNLVARVSYHGKLSGLTTLHFAHWVTIDKGRRLLFLTNFDGSWENYLDDFIDRAAVGLTAIWSNTLNSPRASFLVFGGARDATRFKAAARNSQAYTNFWYSAYPRLTVTGIDNSSGIREDLFTPLDESAARRWLWRF